jgi:beta-galactosidase
LQVRAIDPTRFVSSAIPGVRDADEKSMEALDVPGYNYSPHRYGPDHQKWPARTMVGTESFPQSSFEMWDHIWNSSWVVGDFIWTAIDCERARTPPPPRCFAALAPLHAWTRSGAQLV